MTEATDLAMNLAQVKLELRKTADRYKGRRIEFDAAVQLAIDGLNTAILESSDTVRADNQ